jgi:hypothetical protein
MLQPGLLICGNAGLFNPTQVEPFNAGPVDIRVFADMLERCLKLATTITVAQYYSDNEELGMAYFLRVFTVQFRFVTPLESTMIPRTAITPC